MTDDFELFQDQAGGDAVDPDIALITAYLARELSLIQIAAVEDRLAKDKAFRDKVRPVLDAWTLPVAFGRAPAPHGTLNQDEIDAGWQRYVGEHADVEAHDGPRLLVAVQQQKRRKVSMIRIAAGIAAITLPIVTLAQVAVYVAKRPEVPGHRLAREVVAPFVVAPPAVAPPQVPEKPVPSPDDKPVGRQLETPAPAVQRAAPIRMAEQLAFMASKPDRAKIAGLASQHMPRVVSGDTTANYGVMVFDAAGSHVWSTYGNGSVTIEIAGDRRTPAERAAFAREYAVEYTGMQPRSGGGRGVGARAGRAGGGGGVMRIDSVAWTVRSADSSRVRMPDSIISSARVITGGIGGSGRTAAGGGARGTGGTGGGGGSGGAATWPRVVADSMRISGAVLTIDSAATRMAVRGTVRPGSMGILDYIATDSTGTYHLAFGWVSNGEYINVNEAPGLQQPGKGESGIQGLKSASITLGESYQFTPGQLSPRGLRIIVVHLAPGTNWRGR